MFSVKHLARADVYMCASEWYILHSWTHTSLLSYSLLISFVEAIIPQRAYVFMKFVGGDSRRGLNKRQNEIPRETGAESAVMSRKQGWGWLAINSDFWCNFSGLILWKLLRLPEPFSNKANHETLLSLLNKQSVCPTWVIRTTSCNQKWWMREAAGPLEYLRFLKN